MARRSILQTVVTGAQTILGRLARWFGLGSAGSIQLPLTAQPGRPELETPQQIVEAIAAERLTPTAAQGNIVSRSYLCFWVDEDTGQRYGPARVQAEVPEGIPAIVATVAARQAARLRFSEYVGLSVPEGAHLRLECRQLGSPVVIPAAE